MSAYSLFVVLGIVLGLAVSRYGPPDAIPANVARRTRIGALLGAVIGAHLFELPADLLGWTAPVPGHVGAPFLGRTVLGGLLGGWIGVEIAKLTLGYRGATGDRFAAPLAISLTLGRLGCVVAGCCPGEPIDANSMWAPLSLVHHDPPRFPATLIEAYFHAAASILLVLAARFDVLRGRRLSAYLLALSIVRFGLEGVRANPAILLGLTYYQWLCVPLFVLALGTLVARSRTGRSDAPVIASP